MNSFHCMISCKHISLYALRGSFRLLEADACPTLELFAYEVLQLWSWFQQLEGMDAGVQQMIVAEPEVVKRIYKGKTIPV